MKFLYQYFKKAYYFLINVITLGKGIPITISNFKLKFPAKYHRYFPKDYERDNFNFFRKHCKPGMISLDVGAHFGLFSIFIQKESKGTVYAFEPTPSTLEIIQETIKINHCEETIHVIPAAVDEWPGKALFFVNNVAGLSLANSLIDYHNPEFPQKGYEVNITSIDEFVKKENIKIDFIKIDAEGAELGVLKGGRNTIINNKPLIILSMHPKSIAQRNETNEQIWDFLAPMNYKILLNGNTIEKSTFCNKTDLFDVQLISTQPFS
jgi:FkbM family methyltransferase